MGNKMIKGGLLYHAALPISIGKTVTASLGEFSSYLWGQPEIKRHEQQSQFAFDEGVSGKENKTFPASKSSESYARY